MPARGSSVGQSSVSFLRSLAMMSARSLGELRGHSPRSKASIPRIPSTVGWLESSAKLAELTETGRGRADAGEGENPR